jgi:hypothetical protein
MAEDAPLFLGLDLSTQSVTALVIERSGTVVARSSVNYDQELPHYKTSSGMHRAAEGGGERVTSPVLMWLEAFDMAIERVGRTGVLGRVVAVSASAQQHGSVYWKAGARQKLQALGASHLPLKDALAGCFACEDCPIWADSSTHEECAALEAALGGAERLAAMTGTKYCKSSLNCAFTLQMYGDFFRISPAGTRLARIPPLHSTAVRAHVKTTPRRVGCVRTRLACQLLRVLYLERRLRGHRYGQRNKLTLVACYSKYTRTLKTKC